MTGEWLVAHSLDAREQHDTEEAARAAAEKLVRTSPIAGFRVGVARLVVVYESRAEFTTTEVPPPPPTSPAFQLLRAAFKAAERERHPLDAAPAWYVEARNLFPDIVRDDDEGTI